MNFLFFAALHSKQQNFNEIKNYFYPILTLNIAVSKLFHLYSFHTPCEALLLSYATRLPLVSKTIDNQ